jgi:hypothetical protein
VQMAGIRGRIRVKLCRNRSESHRDERRLRDRNMIPYSGTSKRAFHALFAVAFFQAWVAGITVALLILCWGVLHVANEIQRGDSETASAITFTTNNYTLHAGFSDVGILVFAGLWLRKSVGRSTAIFLSWFWLIGAALLALRLFPFGGIKIGNNADDLGNIPEGVLRAGVFPFLLLQIWQIHLLKRADIRALFRPRLRDWFPLSCFQKKAHAERTKCEEEPNLHA